MRVQLVDPAAFTPPYDHALGAALAAAGADVELLTSRFAHGEVPEPDGFTLTEAFYRRAAGERPAWARRAMRLAEHVPGMLAARGPGADVVHYQWLPIERLDAHLMARGVPRVFTAHNVLRRKRDGGLAAITRRTDAVITHTAAGAAALSERFGADPARVHVIPHGVLDALTRVEPAPLPSELAAVERPVVLAFGILRDYKGHDVLIEAFEDLPDAELWIAGRAMMDVGPLRAAARRVGARVRLIEGFAPDALAAALFRRADVVALPYRRIDQSGVLYTALAFGKAIVLSDVGGFGEVAREHGAAALADPGDALALRAALAALIADPAARAALEERARGAAAGPYSWDDIAHRTLAVYEELTG